MATYSHHCGKCDTTSPRSMDYGDAVDAQTYHRDQVHGGHVPRQGDRIITHPTGWSDGTTGERWAIALSFVVVIIIVVRML